MIKAERLPPVPAEFIARWLKPCMFAEPVKGKCPGPKSKDCPTACHSGGKKKAAKASDSSQSLARGKGSCKTEPWTSRMKRTKAQSPQTKSEQKRLDRIPGRRSQRCLWISTRIGTSSDHRSTNKSTFVHSRITCSYFLLQSHAYVGLYCLKTWFIKTP